MAKFVIDKDLFKKFVETVSMEGIIQFSSNKGTKTSLFNTFYINVEKDRLVISATDMHRKKTDAKFTLNGITCVEEGKIPIVSKDMLLDVLSSKGLEGNITIYNKETIIYIESEVEDNYEIRQQGSMEIDTLKEEEKTQLQKHLEEWCSWHKFDGQNGILVMHVPSRKKEDGTETQPIDAAYPTRLIVKKKDFLKVTGDIINISKSNEVRLILKDGVLRAFIGDANANVMSKHKIPFENTGTELVEFDSKFYQVQTIIPNLFENIELNIRKVIKTGLSTIYIRSIEEQLEVDIALVAVPE